MDFLALSLAALQCFWVLAGMSIAVGNGRRTNPLSREWCCRRLTACSIE